MSELTYEQELAKVSNAQANSYNSNAYTSSMLNNQGKQNLVEWELDFTSELEQIERLLRGDIIHRDDKGNEYWITNPDKTKIFFNEQAVNDILRYILILINKNKALSNYSAEEINDRVRQMKHELRILIYNNYEEYGLDNEYKMNNYSMIVLSIGNCIEDVYRRAMNGETHRGLSEQRLVTQNEGINQQGNMQNPSMATNKKIHWYNPWSW